MSYTVSVYGLRYQVLSLFSEPGRRSSDNISAQSRTLACPHRPSSELNGPNAETRRTKGEGVHLGSSVIRPTRADRRAMTMAIGVVKVEVEVGIGHVLANERYRC